MTGPDHYRAAEELVECAASALTDDPVWEYLAAAKVHATLALAAATIDAEMSNPALDAWADVTGGAR